MPTIHLAAEKAGELADSNVLAFTSLCARIGIKEVLMPSEGYFYRFYAIGGGFVIILSAHREIGNKVPTKLEAAGLKILRCTGDITIDVNQRLVSLQLEVDNLTRVASGQHLVECPICHRAIGDNEFCPYCGAKTDPHLRRCPNCKDCFVPAYIHCPRCGIVLEPTHHGVYEFDEPEEFFWGAPISDNLEGDSVEKRSEDEVD